MIGRRTRRVYQLGDKLTIKVARTDLNKKLLDFALVSEHNSQPKPIVTKGGDVKASKKPKTKKSPTKPKKTTKKAAKRIEKKKR